MASTKVTLSTVGSVGFLAAWIVVVVIGVMLWSSNMTYALWLLGAAVVQLLTVGLTVVSGFLD